MRVLVLSWVLLVGCGDENEVRHVEVTAPAGGEAPAPAGSPGAERFEARTQGGADATLPPDALEQGRQDPGWRRALPGGAGAPPPATTPGTPGAPETLDQISPAALDGPVRTPLTGDVQGPSALHVQILLDRAWFSPGILDGRWGKNAEEAYGWFEQTHGLPADGVVDPASLQELARAAGDPAAVVVQHPLTADDVAGPFVKLPEDPLQRAKLECQCYESLGEKLAERFHTDEDVLRRLNPGVDLDGLRAGQALWVPDVLTRGPAPQGQVAEVVVSDQGHFVHAVTADGRVLMHFPSTLGSTYSPSPEGRWAVAGVHRDPWWHYQPELLEGVPDDRPDAQLPPGPNNAVGVVWIALTKEHYGIHGTSAPETIGYVTSSGCVRLTNWDALTLADHVREGTPVRFVDVAR